jgi:F-type H+-transporting ATPase subunit delta
MAERATIARPYAKAAFAYATEQGRTAQWSRWLDIAHQVVASEEYARLSQSPDVTTAQLLDLVRSICGAELDEAGRTFLALLAENQRVDYLPEIAQHFAALAADAENVADVEIVSATALDQQQQARLADAMRKRLQRDVRLTCRIDPALIGGAIVRSGDLLIDGSLKGKLERLQTELTI